MIFCKLSIEYLIVSTKANLFDIVLVIAVILSSLGTNKSCKADFNKSIILYPKKLSEKGLI